MNDFERQLQRQPLRDLPADWRREILGKCEAATSVGPAWSWREWLWPSPKAWAALAAVWVVFFALSAGEPTSPLPLGAAPHSSASPPLIYAFQPGRDLDALLAATR